MDELKPYNRCPVRVRQGLTRVKKGIGYRPTGKRAPHDVQGDVS